jgi:hypothetical protein
LKRLLLSAAVVAVPAAAAIAATSRLPGASAIVADPHFVALPRIVVPIVDGQRIDGRLSFDLAVVTADDASAKRVGAALPELRATAVMAGTEFSRLQASALTPVDAEALAVRLSASIRQQDPDVASVLIVKVRASAG